MFCWVRVTFYTIIFIHNSSLIHTFFTGVLKALVLERNNKMKIPLKVLVTSATLNAKRFSHFFHDCPILEIPGRMFPVDVLHASDRELHPRLQYETKVLETTLTVHRNEEEGHILVFLTGQEEIERVCLAIRKETKDDEYPPVVLPLYGALSSAQQADVFQKVPNNVRKIVIATNIAETSLTIDGIRYVIDCGFVKQKVN